MWKVILILAFQVVVRGNSIATDNETAKTNESGLVKNQMLGMPVTLGDNKGEQKTAKGSAPRDCTEYCSLSYPPHTYPQPLHYEACRGGCRSSQLDALIAWPAKPDGSLCRKSCDESYSEEKQRYACSSGCKAPTWDTIFPDRAQLYTDVSLPGQEEAEMASLMGQLMAAFVSQANFFSPKEFDQLQNHAVDMEMVIIPYKQMDIAVMMDDDVAHIQQYNVKHKDEGNQDGPWLSYHESRSECIWFRHRLVVSRLLMFLSVVLTVLGLCMCCSSFSSNKSKSDSQQKMSLTQPVQNFPVLYKKAPYDLGKEFLTPAPYISNKEEKVSVI